MIRRRNITRQGLGGRHRISGLAALEFALTAPLLSALFIGSVDSAQVYVATLQLSSAVTAGVNYALMNQASANSTSGASLGSSIATIVGNINGTGWASGSVVINNGPTVSFAGGVNSTSGTAANANSFYCLTGSPGSWTWGTAQAGPSAPCGSTAVTAGKFVTISATVSITPVISGLSFVSGTVSQSVAIQVQ
jgi:Flp pilus assembly protein TadG